MSDATFLRSSGGVLPEHRFARALANDDLLLLLQDLRGRTERTPKRPVTVANDVAHPRIAVIANQRSHRNHAARRWLNRQPDLMYAAPDTHEAMVDALAAFAREGVDLLVIDGGDGTVRDVMSAAGPFFGAAMPPIGLVPSGKTNALAHDLGIPVGSGIDEIRAAFRARKIVERAPIEIAYDGSDVPLRGFLMGTGAFVRATMLAQHTHRMGAFDGIAVGLSVLGAVLQTCMGRASNPWRAGETVSYRCDDSTQASEHRLYMMLLSTLRRFPVGLKPLGRPDEGLNALVVDAPPRMLPLAMPAIIAGKEGGWLARLGYRHLHDMKPSRIRLESGFVLDGETFPEGEVSIRAGDPIRFIVP